jgi:hypothetical protein
MPLMGTLLSLPQKCSNGRLHRGHQPTWVVTKKQQMQWSKEGAHLLLQTRVRTLNGELSAIFKRWYPDMDLEVEEMPVAA